MYKRQRFFCLQSHYRKGLVFTWENLDNAAGTFKKLIAKIAALDPAEAPIDEDAVAALREKFHKALGNDLNTSLAITALYDVLKYQTNDATKRYLLNDFDQVLSLDPVSYTHLFTTQEPDDSMLEVGIRALELVLPEHEGEDQW